MSRHKHANIIHAWVEGTEIEYMNGNGEWVNAGNNPDFFTHIEYRIKPKKSEWFKNIPENGVLCWVRDDAAEHLKADIIIGYEITEVYKYKGKTENWILATPFSNEEIEGLKR